MQNKPASTPTEKPTTYKLTITAQETVGGTPKTVGEERIITLIEVVSATFELAYGKQAKFENGTLVFLQRA